MKEWIGRCVVVVSSIIIMIGGAWIFDRSGLLQNAIQTGSGSLIEQYQTLSETTPRSAKTSSIRDYMEAGSLEKKPHIIHTQQSTVSDFLWIRHIQQVGAFALQKETPGLFSMMDNLISLSPRWAYLYVFMQYIGPQKNHNHKNKTIRIGELGIRMTCDADRLETIRRLSDKDFVSIIEKKGEQYQKLSHPCDDYRLPHTLGFNYFHYMKDLEKAIFYYKVASFDPESPTLTPSMPALLRSKQGKHLISAQMWLDRALSLNESISDITTQGYYDRAIHKAIVELQKHILLLASKSTSECNNDYQCLLSGGHISQIIDKITASCAQKTGSLATQCVLLAQAVKLTYISPNGSLISPLEEVSHHTWIYDQKRGWKTK